MVRAARCFAAVVVSLVGLGVVAPSSATAAEGSYTVTIDGGGTAYDYTLCLKTTTTMARPRGNGSDRICTGRQNYLAVTVFDLSAPYNEGDTVKMDIEMHTGLTGESVTKDDIEITGATNCKLSGTVHAGKFKCDTPINSVQFSPPAIEPYTINTNGDRAIPKLINFMAWLVTAAAVTGLLISGATLASQLRRGALEERTEYMKHIAFVVAACLLATAAGPLIAWLDLAG
ncbi:hypothetical protein [Micromonospora sp. LOL_024]|uniref:hypothetical protein n=1 Tax=Micromonospora sp. LOL_024 TaxID=3345412 RepID=UPI003A86D928